MLIKNKKRKIKFLSLIPIIILTQGDDSIMKLKKYFNLKIFIQLFFSFNLIFYLIFDRFYNIKK